MWATEGISAVEVSMTRTLTRKNRPSAAGLRRGSATPGGPESQWVDNIEKAKEPERSKSGMLMPSRVQFMIFIILCQTVQAFMAYDGGATPASIDTIQAEMRHLNVTWSQTEIGIIGAMDKIGMTATSILWGRLLQMCDTKLLLLIGLFLNAGATAAFGTLTAKASMYFAKFFMGATQSLQSVWATVWIVTWAPAESKTTWLGLTAVSAGIGNGIGTGVAGFTTGAGFPYSFAFQLQAEILFACWVFMVLTPGKWLVTSAPSTVNANLKDEVEGPAVSEAASNSTHAAGTREQFAAVCSNKVYAWTTFGISAAMFVTSGVQFYWIRYFLDVHGLQKSTVTTLFLLVTGLGGASGIALGPPYIDSKLGPDGFSSKEGVYTAMRYLRMFSLAATIAGFAGCAAIYMQVESWTIEGLGTWNFQIVLLLASIFCTFAAQNACIPVLFGINVGVVPVEMRTFASGLEMTSRNILGYASGALVPGVFMDWFAQSRGWDVEGDVLNLAWMVGVGFAFTLAMNLVSLFLMMGATRAARVEAVEESLAAGRELI